MSKSYMGNFFVTLCLSSTFSCLSLGWNTNMMMLYQFWLKRQILQQMAERKSKGSRVPK